MKKGVMLLLFLMLISCVFAGTLSVTTEHPFLIKSEWIPAKHLVVGDLIQTYNGKARITKIEKIEENIPVYNLEDSYYHNYVVGDDKLIVHNSLKYPRSIVGRIFGYIYNLINKYNQYLFAKETKKSSEELVQITKEVEEAVKELVRVPGGREALAKIDPDYDLRLDLSARNMRRVASKILETPPEEMAENVNNYIASYKFNAHSYLDNPAEYFFFELYLSADGTHTFWAPICYPN